MHVFIVTGGTKDSRRAFVQRKNTALTELIHIFAEKSSLTIKQVKELSTSMAISARIPRIIWIEEANLLTIPAQNALLKTLEEPPENTTFYLTCISRSSLLPTIRSRSGSIILNSQVTANDSFILSDLKNIMALTPGDRLTIITKKDRVESIAWITEIETSLRNKLNDKNLSKNNYRTLAKIAKSAIEAHQGYSSNCNVGLVTQHFYLTLPHTRTSK